MERLSIPSVVLICMAAGAAAAGQPPSSITKTFRTNNGMVGVASIAGVTSRNGRVSSVSGVKFYPSGADDMFFFPKLKTGEKIPEPITFSKEENGRITSGTIKYGPGSVSVSSSARSAYPSGSSSSKFPNTKPLVDDMFFSYPPLPMLNSRSFDPWFPNDIAFKPITPPKFNALRSGWPFANNPFSDPFNIWRKF